MHLATYYNGVSIFRRDRAIYGKFLQPHLVISTCQAAGGIQRGVEYVLNQQSCEPNNHIRNIQFRDAVGYRLTICKTLDLPPERCVIMGTAANMHHAAIVYKTFQDLEVIAIVTGGVETNSGRAGDPASVLETEEGFESLADKTKTEIAPGTINTILFISKPLTDGALTGAIITATEAKSAALQELCVNSRYSDGLATGTGTDQIIIAAPDPDDCVHRHTWTSQHSKLGELISQSVKVAVKKTLGRQNGLTPAGQCSAKIHLERFGCTTETMQEGITSNLNTSQATLLLDNFDSINRDPVVVAGIAAMVHLRDKIAWGILPDSCWKEIMDNSGAQLSCSVSGKFDRMIDYREKLAKNCSAHDNDSFLKLCWSALALGFSDKWLD